MKITPPVSSVGRKARYFWVWLGAGAVLLAAAAATSCQYGGPVVQGPMAERGGMERAAETEFILSDGTRLAGLAWVPPQRWGAVLAVHGSVSHAGWFDEVAGHLADAGLAVLAYDRPGWGRSAGPRGAMDRQADALRMVMETAAYARERHGSVHLMGLSWGGLLALRAAMDCPGDFDSMTLVVPGLADRSRIGVARAVRVMAARLVRRSGFRLKLLYTPLDFSRDPERQEAIRTDPLRVGEVSAAFILETRHMRHYVRRMAGRLPLPPAQCLLAGDDTIADNATVRSIATRAGIEVLEYEGLVHSLVFEAPGRVADDVVRLARSVERTVPEGME